MTRETYIIWESTKRTNFALHVCWLIFACCSGYGGEISNYFPNDCTGMLALYHSMVTQYCFAYMVFCSFLIWWFYILFSSNKWYYFTLYVICCTACKMYMSTFIHCSLHLNILNFMHTYLHVVIYIYNYCFLIESQFAIPSVNSLMVGHFNLL